MFKRKQSASRRRHGLTLLEVVLSLLILGVVLAAVGQLVFTGLRAAVRSQLQTQAVHRCGSKLAEVLAGAQPLLSVTGQAFEDDPNWKWNLKYEKTSTPELLQVEVTVERSSDSRVGVVSFQLTRLMREPATRASSRASVVENPGATP